MNNIANLKKVLSEIEINESQMQALQSFFEEFEASIEERIAIDYEEKLSEKDELITQLEKEIEESSSEYSENMSDMILREEAEAAFDMFKKDAEKAFMAFEADAESAFELFEADAEGAFNKLRDSSDKAFQMFQEDAEKAFELFEEDVEKAFTAFELDAESAFELFESDAQKAFELFEEDAETAGELMNEDLKNFYSEKAMKAIEELYTSIESEVKQAFTESDEYRALEDIKKIATPLILEESEDDLAKKIVNLSSEKSVLLEEVESMKKKEIISSLVSDFPAKEASIIQEFIEKGKDEDEIYERFATVIELLEAKSEKKEEIDISDFEESVRREERNIRTFNESERKYKKRNTETADTIKFSNFLSENKKTDKFKKKERNIINEDFTEKKLPNKKVFKSEETSVPFFESSSVENNSAKKKEKSEFKPHELKIIDKVFG